MHASLSFPSGHTTACVFLAGALLWVLLPRALTAAGWGAPAPAAAPREPAQGLSAAAIWAAHPAVRFAAWGLMGGTTAAGRVLADAHWLSDTAAGACVGAGSTALLVAAVAAVEGALASSAAAMDEPIEDDGGAPL
jgi:membrane-associated phospholipid phosphatase